MSDMEFKHFKFEIKAEDDGDMTVSGYASIFGNRDRVGDVVVAGLSLNRSLLAAESKCFGSMTPRSYWRLG